MLYCNKNRLPPAPQTSARLYMLFVIFGHEIFQDIVSNICPVQLPTCRYTKKIYKVLNAQSYKCTTKVIVHKVGFQRTLVAVWTKPCAMISPEYFSKLSPTLSCVAFCNIRYPTSTAQGPRGHTTT